MLYNSFFYLFSPPLEKKPLRGFIKNPPKNKLLEWRRQRHNTRQQIRRMKKLQWLGIYSLQTAQCF